MKLLFEFIYFRAEFSPFGPAVSFTHKDVNSSVIAGLAISAMRNPAVSVAQWTFKTSINFLLQFL